MVTLNLNTIVEKHTKMNNLIIFLIGLKKSEKDYCVYNGSEPKMLNKRVPEAKFFQEMGFEFVFVPEF